MPKTSVLYYYLVLKNTDKPLAGTSTAILRATQKLAQASGSFELVLTGDQVAREEAFPDGRRLVPLPPPEKLAAFVARFDVVVLASHMAALESVPKRPGQKWVLLQHCWDLMPDIPAALSLFDRIIASSPMHRDNLARLGADPAKISVIANFVDPGEYAPPPSPAQRHSLVYCGALVPHKGVHVLVEAMAQVAEEEPAATLDIYGAADMWLDFDPGYEGRLREAARGLPIRFHGPVPHNSGMPEVFRRHGIFCLPSQCETFPLTVLEAQACGCIPVVHDGGGSAATLRHGETGFLYAPNTPKALAAAILSALGRLREDPGLPGRAAEYVHATFGGAPQTDALLALLRGL